LYPEDYLLYLFVMFYRCL